MQTNTRKIHERNKQAWLLEYNVELTNRASFYSKFIWDLKENMRVKDLIT